MKKDYRSIKNYHLYRRPLAGSVEGPTFCLVRTGKDPAIALERRDADEDVAVALAQCVPEKGNAWEWTYDLGEAKFRVTVKREE